jgi:hypothetical protein
MSGPSGFMARVGDRLRVDVERVPTGGRVESGAMRGSVAPDCEIRATTQASEWT